MRLGQVTTRFLQEVGLFVYYIDRSLLPTTKLCYLSTERRPSYSASADLSKV